MGDKFSFLVGEAASAFRRNGLMTFAAITTVAVALFILGGMGYAYWRLDTFATTMKDRFDLRVLLKDGATETTIKDVIERIRNIPGVESAVYIPAQKQWELMQIEQPDLTANMENPLPEAFKVVVSDIQLSDEVAKEMLEFAEVANVVYLQDEVRLVHEAMKTMRVVGSTVGGLLLLTAGILIYNTIRLTVVARRLEIRVMQLVGASRLTIQVPFLLEGIVQGIIGGLVATGLIWSAHTAYNAYITQAFTSAAERAAAPHVGFPLGIVFLILGSAGAFYGLLCSSFAVNTPLKYR